MQDVAALAGVSVGSVSRVLNERQNVNPAIQDAVRKAMATLAFQPNVVARSMRMGTSSAIGVLVSDVTQHTAAQMVSAAEERMRQRGFELFIANSHYDLDRERGILASLRQRRLDGFIGAISDDENPEYFNILKDLNMPVVLWERDAQGQFNSVLTDHADGCRQALEHLIGLGHQRIALIAGREGTWVGREMVRGYMDAYEAARLPFESELVCRTNEFNRAVCMTMLKSKSRPSAIIATVNDVAIILSCVRELNIQIPLDLSIISIGEHEYASVTSPALTVVTQNARDIGREAADMLLALLDKPEVSGTRRSIHPMKLIVRESCSIPPHTAKRKGRTIRAS